MILDIKTFSFFSLFSLSHGTADERVILIVLIVIMVSIVIMVFIVIIIIVMITITFKTTNKDKN